MISNYHTHTARCNHATGTEREYVENAIDRGLKILGFSDHTPQYFPGDYCTFMRMRPYQLQEYCAEVKNLQREYSDRIQIHTGLEVEYYPAFWDALLPRARDAGVEYFLLGQHWLGNELGEPGSGVATEDENILRRYCHQICDAIETGKFTYIAHPDLINFVGSRKIYQHHVRDLCRAAKQSGTPLEINLLGMASGRQYPNEAFWEIAAEEGCHAILGMDAHAPKHILNTQLETRALELVQRFELDLLDTFAFRQI